MIDCPENRVLSDLVIPKNRCGHRKGVDVPMSDVAYGSALRISRTMEEVQGMVVKADGGILGGRGEVLIKRGRGPKGYLKTSNELTGEGMERQAQMAQNLADEIMEQLTCTCNPVFLEHFKETGLRPFRVYIPAYRLADLGFHSTTDGPDPRVPSVGPETEPVLYSSKQSSRLREFLPPDSRAEWLIALFAKVREIVKMRLLKDLEVRGTVKTGLFAEEPIHQDRPQKGCIRMFNMECYDSGSMIAVVLGFSFDGARSVTIDSLAWKKSV